MLENLKITSESKRGLEWLKETYSLSTYSIAIDTVVQFFKLNKMNPKDYSYGDIEKTINTTKNELHKKNHEDTERIISIIRNIEINLFQPMNKKLIEIHQISVDNHNSKSNLNIEKLIDSSTEDYSKLNENIKKNDEIIKNYKIELNDLTKKLNDYHNCLEKLNKSVSIVQIENEDKVIFKGSVKEVQDLFYLIP